MKKYGWIICFIVFGFLGCSGGEIPDTAFLGAWRMESSGGQHTVMSLKTNGTFEIDLRIEGELTKIVEKRGSAAGTWQVSDADGLFVLNVTRGDPTIGWPEGEITFRIGQTDRSHLVLISPDGRKLYWEKSTHQNSESAPATEGPAITLAPLVISLMPSENEATRRYKWLCVAMDIQLSPGSSAPELRPQLKDKVILLLSSKAYEDINTMDKLESVSNEIRNLLNPYLDGTVERVLFSKTIVTGRPEAVDTFCAEYQS